jgi:D-sedoheptulose 7-phosphate isomerase
LSSFVKKYFEEVISISKLIDYDQIDKLVVRLCDLREKKGRLFFIGVGGSAGNASHAVNDFRKLCGIECYAPTDNISELTARTNDDGWDTVFSSWLNVSNISNNDAIFILSVGGGNEEKKISNNIVEAIKFVKKENISIFGIVGMETGYTAIHGHNVIIVPNVNLNMVTPHSESFQSVIWHCLVSHPKLQKNKTTW